MIEKILSYYGFDYFKRNAAMTNQSHKSTLYHSSYNPARKGCDDQKNYPEIMLHNYKKEHCNFCSALFVE